MLGRSLSVLCSPPRDLNDLTTCVLRKWAQMTRNGINDLLAIGYIVVVTNLPSGQTRSVKPLALMMSELEVDYHGYLPGPVQGSAKCAVVKFVLASI
ncbi:hypothetical protein TNCV_1553861 [Trichonephila clavipes]|nr:hypothetical protein TNCV_1553861 [Trichonephila clavipes]